jgi:hypothetical protein
MRSGSVTIGLLLSMGLAAQSFWLVCCASQRVSGCLAQPQLRPVAAMEESAMKSEPLVRCLEGDPDP